MFRRFMTFISPKILSFILPYLKRKEMSKGILHHIQPIVDRITAEHKHIKLTNFDNGLLASFIVKFSVYEDKHICLEICANDNCDDFHIFFRGTSINHLSELKSAIDTIYEKLTHPTEKATILSAFKLKLLQSI